MFDKKKKQIEELTKDVKHLKERLDTTNDYLSEYYQKMEANVFGLKNPNGVLTSGTNIYNIVHQTYYKFQYTKNEILRTITFYDKNKFNGYTSRIYDDIGYIQVRIKTESNSNNTYKYFVVNLDKESIVEIDKDISSKLNNSKWTEFTEN